MGIVVEEFISGEDLFCLSSVVESTRSRKHGRERGRTGIGRGKGNRRK